MKRPIVIMHKRSPSGEFVAWGYADDSTTRLFFRYGKWLVDRVEYGILDYLPHGCSDEELISRCNGWRRHLGVRL